MKLGEAIPDKDKKCECGTIGKIVDRDEIGVQFVCPNCGNKYVRLWDKHE
jgi:predicted RNA-binding Zn-ribbon protein involved in translation (DUF1610 family)